MVSEWKEKKEKDNERVEVLTRKRNISFYELFSFITELQMVKPLKFHPYHEYFKFRVTKRYSKQSISKCIQTRICFIILLVRGSHQL